MTESKKKVGRPRSTMTDENIEAVLRAVRMGLHPDRAAEAAGVAPSTMRMHKKRNPQFVTALKEAAAEAEKSYLGRIIQHSENQWTAAAWILERRWPERWRKRDESDVKVKVKQRQTGPAAPQGEDLAGYLERLSAMPGLIRDRLSRN